MQRMMLTGRLALVLSLLVAIAPGASAEPIYGRATGAIPTATPDVVVLVVAPAAPSTSGGLLWIDVQSGPPGGQATAGAETYATGGSSGSMADSVASARASAPPSATVEAPANPTAAPPTAGLEAPSGGGATVPGPFFTEGRAVEGAVQPPRPGLRPHPDPASASSGPLNPTGPGNATASATSPAGPVASTQVARPMGGMMAAMPTGQGQGPSPLAPTTAPAGGPIAASPNPSPAPPLNGSALATPQDASGGPLSATGAAVLAAAAAQGTTPAAASPTAGASSQGQGAAANPTAGPTNAVPAAILVNLAGGTTGPAAPAAAGGTSDPGLPAATGRQLMAALGSSTNPATAPVAATPTAGILPIPPTQPSLIVLIAPEAFAVGDDAVSGGTVQNLPEPGPLALFGLVALGCVIRKARAAAPQRLAAWFTCRTAATSASQ